MAIVVIGDLPVGNAQTDQEMMSQLGVSPTNPPEGALARMAGPKGSGYRILSVWESADAWETFKRERLGPAFQQANRPMPAFEVWELDTYFTSPS